jgi:glycosyltransferase involved in cell wall biosynthesis
MYKGWKISVVTPCHNEEEGIKVVMADMPRLVDEVVVVDNNSTDRTAEVARGLGAVVVSESRQGYGAAYKAGFRRATGDVVVTMDGDGTYPRNFIPVLLDIMFDENIDFISCDRTGHKQVPSPFLRVFGNWVLSTVMAFLFFVRLKDSQSGMWIFKRRFLDETELASDGMAFSEEIKIEAFARKGFRARELPIYYTGRVGQSKLNMWRDGFANLIFLFRKRAMM